MYLKFKTNTTFTDITKKVIPTIEKGFIVVSSLHTTCGIAILENEILLRKDMDAFLERLAPKCGIYAHDDIEKRDVPPDERINGFSHIRSLIFPTSVTIPVGEFKLIMGQWQSIFLVELDPQRERTVYIGEIDVSR